MVLERQPPEILQSIVKIVRAHDESKIEPSLNDLVTLEVLTVCQAFFMGYYYRILSNVVDASMLEIKTVSGYWGYGSRVFLKRVFRLFYGLRAYHNAYYRNNVFLASRTDVLSLTANLYANMDVELPEVNLEVRSSQRELCVGVVGERIILTSRRIRPYETLDDLARLVILNIDSGGIPRSAEGLILTRVQPQFPRWDYGDTPASCDNITLTGPKQDFTRHIEAEWDGVPERLLLCIRINRRRVGSINPTHSDATLWQSSVRAHLDTSHDMAAPIYAHGRGADGSIISQSLIYPEARKEMSLTLAHKCTLDDFAISRRLVTPGRKRPEIPVAVHSKGAPTMRYAAASWYTDICNVVLVQDTLENAFIS